MLSETTPVIRALWWALRWAAHSEMNHREGKGALLITACFRSASSTATHSVQEVWTNRWPAFTLPKLLSWIPLEILMEATWKPKIAIQEYFWYQVERGIRIKQGSAHLCPSDLQLTACSSRYRTYSPTVFTLWPVFNGLNKSQIYHLAQVCKSFRPFIRHQSKV